MTIPAAPEFTAAEIQAAIVLALQAHDIEAVGALMMRLAVVDPNRCELLRKAMLTHIRRPS